MSHAEGLPEWFIDTRPVGESPRGMTLENELKAGKYGVIRSLLRVLEGGAASKVSKMSETQHLACDSLISLIAEYKTFEVIR